MKFIAHRGYSARYPENSLPAFAATIGHATCGQSVVGIELDIHLTADGRIPVMHETRITGDDSTPVSIAKLNFKELQRLFARQYGAASPGVAAIEEVFAIVDHRLEINCEIKIGDYDLDRFTRIFAGVLDNYTPQGDITISSFSPEILEFVRPRLEPFGVKFAFIFKSIDVLRGIPAAMVSRYDRLHPWYRLLIDYPEDFSSATCPPVHCWTVNDRATADQLIRLAAHLPIEAIMTDDLELASSFSSNV
jgi:glycerophosphoryl diester phosphodiesterase